ncbi:thiamine biosynthesis protein ApbE [Methylomonas methanica]|uniref:FAD:protein FMN transferase n=1 Tax=Methylomonas methanica TaxID=421 RepID=A0A177MBI7_METMH|nr:FAD:protein FMN transferase [Methylomonas methanica]OAI03011.1 thiamine biosynthesis protein ApbE [Methylomonas methanica]
MLRKGWNAVILGLLLVQGCAEPLPPVKTFSGFAQGTTYHISYWAPQALDEAQITAEVEKVFVDLDKALSNYRPDSIIEQFNASTSTDGQQVGEEIVALVKIAQNVSALSQGCYDLTIRPLFELWGFMGDDLTIPDDATLQAALANVGMDKLQLVDDSRMSKKLPNLRVDVSSIAQGYSVEKISNTLQAMGIQNYLVEIGGELKALGSKPDGKAWRIAVEKPLPGEQKMHKVVTLPKDSPMSVMTSGTYRHYFDVKGKRYSHILDARNGTPVMHDLVAVSVFNESPTIADAWSTALLCLGQEEGMKLADAEKLQVMFIQQQGTEFLESKTRALTMSTLVTIN